MLIQIICSTPVTQQIFCAGICLPYRDLPVVYFESSIFQMSVIVVNSDGITISAYRQGKFNSYDQLPNVEPNNLKKTTGFLRDYC